jgi:hypothetical protein
MRVRPVLHPTNGSATARGNAGRRLIFSPPDLRNVLSTRGFGNRRGEVCKNVQIMGTFVRIGASY